MVATVFVVVIEANMYSTKYAKILLEIIFPTGVVFVMCVPITENTRS